MVVLNLVATYVGTMHIHNNYILCRQTKGKGAALYFLQGVKVHGFKCYSRAPKHFIYVIICACTFVKLDTYSLCMP